MSVGNHSALTLGPDNFINRELSWLEFNRRVLALAQDESLPLLERVRFLTIFSTNLDEFYMVRVASLRNKMELGISSSRPDGKRPAEAIVEIRERVLEMVNEQRATMRQVLAALQEAGICIGAVADLPRPQQEAVREYFRHEVYPVLTPLAVDHARPFPFISNLSLNLAVWLRREADGDDGYEFVRIKVPEHDVLARLVDVGSVIAQYSTGATPKERTFIWLEDAIAQNLDLLFPGMDVFEQHPFRVTRNADIDYEYEQEDEFSDISMLIEESVLGRRFGPVVRLSVPDNISEATLTQLIAKLDVQPERDNYMIDGALGASGLVELCDIERPDLKYPPHIPKARDAQLHPKEIFATIRQGDRLVHHPYDSFAPVEEFFRAAAKDPDVLAIKTTLYRVGQNSPIVQALMDARDNDKQVAVLVELKARFDEKNNLDWARELDDKGVHVIYGVEELPVKTHAKIALVVRREYDRVRRYVHLGTGNYNSTTARQYTDLGLFTCNEEIGADASALFNRLTGYAPATTYKHLLVAPDYLQAGILDLIDNEIAAAQAGKPARLIFKMNQLEDDQIILKLYEASRAGVEIDLIVRGLCCLRPGVAGLSETIRVRSIIGRFLEHSRIFYFHNAQAGRQIYAGSADLMRRNMYNRVEVVFPILDQRIQRQMLRILLTSLSDNHGAWELLSDGTYRPAIIAEGEELLDSQKIFMQDSSGLPAISLT